MKHGRIPRNEFRSEYSAFRCLSLNSLPWRSSGLVPSQDTTFCACTRGEGNSPAVLCSSHKSQWRVTYWGTALARIVLRFITPCPSLFIGIVCFPLFSMSFKENAGLIAISVQVVDLLSCINFVNVPHSVQIPL